MGDGQHNSHTKQESRSEKTLEIGGEELAETLARVRGPNYSAEDTGQGRGCPKNLKEW